MTRGNIAVVLSLLVGGSTSLRGDSIYAIQIVADNDFALFTGTNDSITRLIYQNDEGWPSQISAASSQEFALQGGETTFYLLGMGGGGDENISGTANDVDMTSISVLMSSDLASSLSSYNPSLVADGTYSANLADVQAAFAGLTWGSPTLTTEDAVVMLAAPNQIGYHFGNGTARLFQFSAADVTIVPEFSTGWLCISAAGALLLIRRLRRLLN